MNELILLMYKRCLYKSLKSVFIYILIMSYPKNLDDALKLAL